MTGPVELLRPREILMRAGARDDVVLDAHAAEFRELLDALPLDHLPQRLPFRFIEKLIYEIEPRLDGYHEPVFQFPRQPQERMVGRPLDLTA